MNTSILWKLCLWTGLDIEEMDASIIEERVGADATVIDVLGRIVNCWIVVLPISCSIVICNILVAANK